MSEAPTPFAAVDILWSDARLLGYAELDRTHEEFYSVAFKLLTADEAGALAAIRAFEQHALGHFEMEERWMLDTNFPSRECHADEHAAVLTSVRETVQALEQGTAGAELTRRLAEHLFAWFPGHADYMDSALAAWMCKRAYGGSPVVLRRSLA